MDWSFAPAAHRPDDPTHVQNRGLNHLRLAYRLQASRFDHALTGYADSSYQGTPLPDPEYSDNVRDVYIRRACEQHIRGDFNGDSCEDVMLVMNSGSCKYLDIAGDGFTSDVWTRNDLTIGDVTYLCETNNTVVV